MSEKNDNEEVCFRILTFELLSKAPPSRSHLYSNCDVSYLRLFGKTADNKVVSVWADGFHPYFFLQVPEHWDAYHASQLRDYILDNVRNARANLVSCEHQMSVRLYGFSDCKQVPFIKLSFKGISSMKQCRRFFDTPHKFDWETEQVLLKVCEQSSKIPDSLKVIHDSLIQPSGWVTIKKSDIMEISGETRSHMNIHTHLKHIVPVESNDIPNFIEMCMDGEMISPTFEFPRAERIYDIIAMFALNFRRRNDANPYREILLCLGHMDPIEGVEVLCFDKESDLLDAFVNIVHFENPDIWTGYNIKDFDLPYLLRRAKKLQLSKLFYEWGRVFKEFSELNITYKSKEKFGKNVSTEHRKVKFDTVKIPGCRIEDALKGVKSQMKKLTSYKLENVANYYLGVGKHPVEPEDIFRAYQDITDGMIAADNAVHLNHFMTEIRVMLAFDHVTRSKNLTDPENRAHFSSAQSFFAESYILKKVSAFWAKNYHKQIEKVLMDVIRVLSDQKLKAQKIDQCPAAYSYETCEQILRKYVDMRTKGTTLMFGPVLLNLNDAWFTKGISLSEIPDENEDAQTTLNNLLKTPPKVSRKSKREREEERDDNGFDNQETVLTRDNGFFQEGLKRWESRIEAEAEVNTFLMKHKTTKKFAQTWWRVRKECNDPNTKDTEKQKGIKTYERYMKQHLEWLNKEKLRIGEYCIQDARLPCKLRQKQQHAVALMEMSRVTYVPCDMLEEKGQTIKIINLLMMWCRKNNFVITYEQLEGIFFQGARVINPKIKFYRDRVFTLDFSSLYPSLIQENRLCFLSLILPWLVQQYLNRPDLEINSINIGEPSNQVYHWVQNTRVALPEILEFLVSQRNLVKAELAKETDPVKKVVLDQRQNSYKLCGNSAYGFTGYEHSPFPCMAIAVCTTKKGRDAICTAEKTAEERFQANVVYGDTDSIMAIVRNFPRKGPYNLR